MNKTKTSACQAQETDKDKKGKMKGIYFKKGRKEGSEANDFLFFLCLYAGQTIYKGVAGAGERQVWETEGTSGGRYMAKNHKGICDTGNL